MEVRMKNTYPSKFLPFFPVIRNQVVLQIIWYIFLWKILVYLRNTLLRSNIRLIWYRVYSLRNNRFSIGTMEAPCHRKSKQRLLPCFTVVFLISLENYLDCFGNALFAFPGLKRTQSQDRNWFSFPGNAVHVERFIHSKKEVKL